MATPEAPVADLPIDDTYVQKLLEAALVRTLTLSEVQYLEGCIFNLGAAGSQIRAPVFELACKVEQ